MHKFSLTNVGIAINVYGALKKFWSKNGGGSTIETHDIAACDDRWGSYDNINDIFKALERLTRTLDVTLRQEVWRAEDIREFSWQLNKMMINFDYKVPIETISTLVEYSLN